MRKFRHRHTHKEKRLSKDEDKDWGWYIYKQECQIARNIPKAKGESLNRFIHPQNFQL
jgi:hypothetical protein